jgi:hypothetical protein
MKKALAGVLVASLVGLLAVGATAQVPNVQVYFHGNPAFGSFSDTQAFCQSPGTPQLLYVVLNNYNMFVQGVDFSIDYPPALFPGGETPPAETLVIGSSNANGGTGGIAVSWINPQNGFAPLLALTVNAIWTSNCDCLQPPQALVVCGWSYGTQGNGGKADPTAVRWPDFAEISVEGSGQTSLVCPGAVSVEETTWGGIKALYR